MKYLPTLQTIKRHLISMALTFVAGSMGFFMLVDPSMDFKTVLYGCLFAGVREVAKILFELSTYYAGQKKLGRSSF
jgi:hypothetical protein